MENSGKRRKCWLATLPLSSPPPLHCIVFPKVFKMPDSVAKDKHTRTAVCSVPSKVMREFEDCTVCS